MFAVDSKKRKGGLILLWRDPFSVVIQSFSDGHIDCIVKNGVTSWRFAGFYGYPTVALRTQSWQLLQLLADILELKMFPCLVGKDFNEIWYDSKKAKGFSRPIYQIVAFSDTLKKCDLYDLHAKGDPYSWCNKRQGDENILARLDRFVCNFDLHSRFSTAEAKHLAYYGSDLHLNTSGFWRRISLISSVKIGKRPGYHQFA